MQHVALVGREDALGHQTLSLLGGCTQLVKALRGRAWHVGREWCVTAVALCV